MQGFHRGFHALDDLALVALPTLLKGKLLVIDDIERKHDKLHIDEILGFIDECVQVHKCRVLLVLNDDKLKDKDIWEQFREKVIDQELRLDTSAAEAFDIAKDIVKTEWAEPLEKATVTCGVTNIRILCKIIRLANRLLEGHGHLQDEVIEKVIPSVVLLSTIHFISLPDGPTFEYLLDYNGTVSATLRAIRARQGDPDDSEEDARHGQWDSLLSSLHACGVNPIWAITGIPAATSFSTWGSISIPPSSLTACAPPSFIKRTAVWKHCSGDPWYEPKGRSAMINACSVARETALTKGNISSAVTAKVES